MGYSGVSGVLRYKFAWCNVSASIMYSESASLVNKQRVQLKNEEGGLSWRAAKQ